MTKTQWKYGVLCGLLVTSLMGNGEAAEITDSETTALSKESSIKQLAPLPEKKSSNWVVSGNGGILRPAYDEDVTDLRQAPKEKKNKKDKAAQDTSISPENPMVVKADKMRYSQATGDVDAIGNVDIHHMMDTYQTQYLYGNTLTQKYIIPGDVTWENPTARVRAERVEYDAQKGVGKLENLSGWESNTYYFQGHQGVYDRDANYITVKDGYFTTRHAVAKVPDYRIEAESIDIYPGDKYIAHNVKLMAKNTVLFTLSSYQGSLKQDHSVSLWTLFPRPTFDSDNGFGLTNTVAVPLDKDMRLTAYMKNRWYTKAGYKPDIGLRYNTSVGNVRFHYAENESSTNDDGGIWVKKRPSLEFDSKHFYLFGSRFYAGVRGELGYWDEDGVKGSYKGFDAYVSGDPWKLGPFMDFNWRVGYAKDYYGATDTTRRIGYYGVGLSGHYRSVSSWLNYTDRAIKGVTPYRYDTFSSDKPLYLGIRVEVTPLDAFSLAWTIDTRYGLLQHRYWTYYRDLHSFYAWLRYDDIENEVRFMVMPKDFRF